MSGAAYQQAKARAVGALHGRVLEIGAGRGSAWGLYAADVDWHGLEPSARRVRALAESAARHGHHRPPMRARAEDIPLPDARVDAVVSIVTLCSVSDQDRALAEIARVLAPGGRLVVAEHVVAPAGTWRRRAQRLAAPFSRLLDHGCDPARDTEAALRRSRLVLRSLHRFELPTGLGFTLPYVVAESLAAPRRPPEGDHRQRQEQPERRDRDHQHAPHTQDHE